MQQVAGIHYKNGIYLKQAGECGAIAGVEGIIRDVTGRWRAERALVESEEKYRSVVENMKDAIYIQRKDRLLFVDRQASELSGSSRDELMRITPRDIVHPDDRKRLTEGQKNGSGERTRPPHLPPGFSPKEAWCGSVSLSWI